MMKKGYTLVELMIVICVGMIICSIAIYSIRNFDKLSNNTSNEFACFSLIAVINHGKQFCRVKESSGKISFNLIKGEIYFYCNDKFIERYSLPKGFILYDINNLTKEIHIDRQGVTSDACTITYKDISKKLHHITICVGTGYAEIKD